MVLVETGSMAKSSGGSKRDRKDAGYDPDLLPDYHTDFISQDDLNSFAAALEAPSNMPVTALNDWKPIHQKIKKSRSRKKARTKDETVCAK